MESRISQASWDCAAGARILVAITVHFDPADWNATCHLAQVLRSLSEFPAAAMDVILVTNTDRREDVETLERLCSEVRPGESSEVRSYGALAHPYDLTWCHKAIIQREFAGSDRYTHFIYTEDDVVIGFANFAYFLGLRDRLRHFGLLPSFVRTEYSAAQRGMVASDAFWPIYVPVQPHLCIERVVLLNMPNPYNPCFILDQELAREYIASPSFDQERSRAQSPSGVRRRAAMGLCWENVPLPFYSRYVVAVSSDTGMAAGSAYICHLPANYANKPSFFARQGSPGTAIRRHGGLGRLHWLQLRRGNAKALAWLSYAALAGGLLDRRQPKSPEEIVEAPQHRRPGPSGIIIVAYQHATRCQ